MGFEALEKGLVGGNRTEYLVMCGLLKSSR